MSVKPEDSALGQCLVDQLSRFLPFSRQSHTETGVSSEQPWRGDELLSVRLFSNIADGGAMTPLYLHKYIWCDGSRDWHLTAQTSLAYQPVRNTMTVGKTKTNVIEMAQTIGRPDL